MCVCVRSAASASLSLPEEEQAKREPTYYLNALNPETRATLEQLSRDAELQVVPSGLPVPCLSSRVPAGGVNVSLFLQKKKKPAESKGKEKATSRTAVSLRLHRLLQLHCSEPSSSRPTTPLGQWLVASRPPQQLQSQRTRQLPLTEIQFAMARSRRKVSECVGWGRWGGDVAVLCRLREAADLAGGAQPGAAL